MNITICGSIAFIDKMIASTQIPEEMGHMVLIPEFVAQDEHGKPMTQEEFYRVRKEYPNSDLMTSSWFEREKSRAIREHFDKIEKSDAILVTNYPKNGVEGYIGGNTLIEIGLAFYLKKKIYFLNPIPELPYKEELIGMSPFILNGDLSLMK